MIRLKVFRVEQVCFFELTWGSGQQLTAQLAYPETLTQLYETWQRCYLAFYQTIGSTTVRGRVKSSGTLSAAPIDHRAKLVAAEAAFLAEFYDWLKSRELLDLRSQIAQIAQDDLQDINLFLTCEPLALARFPWETWEILGEFGQRSELRIIRTPANLRHRPTGKMRSGKMRILVILGDETGLSFQAETEALKSLERFADVIFEGWRVGESTAGLKERIANRLTEAEGWDILFFAGHSNESVLTGGELAIAPQTSIFLNEIKPQLLKAKDNGLQFAIFNSCKGLDLANTLVDLGLSQVAIMREPIHNSVAQEFLIQFIQNLVSHASGESKTVQDSILTACEYLKLDRNLTYPSSYFVPSFFCHPETVPFTPRRIGVSQHLRQIIPSPVQAIALGLISITSLLTPVQDLMLDGRLYVQALYRQTTRQIPTDRHQIRIVQIDEASLRGGLIPARKINPIDRAALAGIVDRLVGTHPKVLAIDYLLDRPMPEDPILAKQITRAAQKQIPVIFGADLQNNREMDISTSITRLDTAMQGHVLFYPGYLSITGLQTVQVSSQSSSQFSCQARCPFSFLTAFAAQADDRRSVVDHRTFPNTDGADQRSQLLKNSPEALSRIQPKGLPKLLWNWANLGFQPIVDYSIPPDRIYKTTSAIDLTTTAIPTILEPIVLLAAGDYAEAGINADSRDKFPMPSAIAHWRKTQNQPPQPMITGAELQAYMMHHFLHQHYVISIPSIVFIIPAGLLGILIASRSRSHRHTGQYSVTSFLFSKSIRNFWIGAGIYGLVTLQLTIALGLLIPWVFPILTTALLQVPLLKSSNSRKHSR
jgi:CHASE2 domain